MSSTHEDPSTGPTPDEPDGAAGPGPGPAVDPVVDPAVDPAAAAAAEREASLLREVDDLVGRWLSLPEAAEVLGADVTRVRSLLDEGALVAVRRGRPRVLSVPSALVEPDPLPGLTGTMTLLADSGFDRLESLRWLFQPHPSLAGDPPVVRMRLGQRGEIRRLAQALAF